MATPRFTMVPLTRIMVIWLLSTSTDAFMYRPSTGVTWDPSCMTWGGKTYCYFMYVCGTGTPGCATNETHYGHGLVAVELATGRNATLRCASPVCFIRDSP